MLDSDRPTVTIITLLSGRRKFLPLLKACVSAQTYPSECIEWVVIDDGDEDLSALFNGPSELYIRCNKPLNIGRKRQYACDIASGEFLFFFDDDDLHFPHRIERCVEKLQKLGARMVAGNTEMYLADAASEEVIKVGPHHKNHATAATMVFRKEFLKHSSFRPSDRSGEEMHFLMNWTIPVVQLHPGDTIVALSHNENTVSKRHLFEEGQEHSFLTEVFAEKNLLKLLRSITERKT